MTNWIEWDKIAPTFTTTPATTSTMQEEPNDFYCDPAEIEDNSTAEPFDQNQYNTFKAIVKAYREGK
jgi:hypothetical protein